MGFNYNESVVLWTYHKDKPGDYNPTINKLNKWDKDLFDSYENKLVELLNEYEIPISRETKSRVLLLATVSNGETISMKVRNACKYYMNTWGIDLDPSD
jgi:hypothetical protein